MTRIYHVRIRGRGTQRAEVAYSNQHIVGIGYSFFGVLSCGGGRAFVRRNFGVAHPLRAKGGMVEGKIGGAVGAATTNCLKTLPGFYRLFSVGLRTKFRNPWP